jgi:hypothetical protein
LTLLYSGQCLQSFLAPPQAWKNKTNLQSISGLVIYIKFWSNLFSQSVNVERHNNAHAPDRREVVCYRSRLSTAGDGQRSTASPRSQHLSNQTIFTNSVKLDHCKTLRLRSVPEAYRVLSPSRQLTHQHRKMR